MNLDCDILWTIFILNASQGASRLKTTLASSQVCQEWRNIILGSYTLWGRLVRLTPSRKEEFIEEIIRRSGSSPLWIEALIGDSINQLTRVLDSYWDRIELLDISGRERHLPCHEEALSKVLSRPAPILRSFSFINTDHTRLSFENRGPLFALHAPQLHTLVNNIIILPSHFTLFSDLRTLSWRPHGTFHEILDGLRYMRNIETLTMRKIKTIQTIDRDILDRLPQVSLPHLTHLSMLISSLEAFVAFFDRITMSPAGCIGRLYVDIKTRGEDLKSCLSRMGHPLAKFVANHVKSMENSHKISIHIHNHKFIFTLDDYSRIKFYWKNYGRSSPPHEYVSFFFAAFMAVDFSCMTHLRLAIPDLAYKRCCFNIFLPLLSTSLSNITHLGVSMVFFRFLYLQYMQDHDECAFLPFDQLYIDFPFPNLQHLLIEFSVYSRIVVCDFLGANSTSHILLQFLRTQKALGRGPSVLCVNSSLLDGTNSGNPYIRDLLGEIDGLEVVWIPSSY